MTIITIFVVIGVLLPYAQSSINTDSQDFGLNSINDDVASASPVTALTIFLSIIKMFTFTFGDLPIIIDLILFMPLRIIAWVIIASKIRGT